MISVIIIGLIYFVLLDFLSMLFSVRLCGTLSSLTSDNFECGFYSILSSSLKYRYNYWLIILHFLIFEQELIIALIWVYSVTLNANNLACFLLCILFIELLLQ